MSDARFIHNSPTCDVDLIVALLEIYVDHIKHLDDTFNAANVLKTEEARMTYLNTKNYLGIAVRLEFISYMKQKKTYFDVEEALKAIQLINFKNHKPRFKVIK